MEDFTGGVTAQEDVNGQVFDLSGVEENKTFEVMPKGNYPAVVDELDFGTSKAGNPMITVKYAITDGEFAKRVIFDYWVMAGNGGEYGLAKLKKFLTRICPDVELTNFKPAEFAELGTAVGRICTLVLGIQTQKDGEYKGEKRNTVKDILTGDAASGGLFG